MNRLLMIAAVALAALATAPRALAASASAGVGATIVSGAIRVEKQGDLEFGSLVPAARPETVTLDAGGMRAKTGDIALVAAAMSPAAAHIAVTGAPNALFSITLPASVTLSLVGDEAAEMAVTDFTSSAGAVGTLGSDGTQSLAIGATLHVGADQPIGRYVGTFEVTIAYQ